jgi:predicted lipoprotein with Yx(FWY)xxD motif
MLALAGCTGVTDPRVCTAYAAAAITTYVKDSVTGSWAGSGTTLVVQDGTFVDSVSVPAGRPDVDAMPLSTPGTYERSGTYLVTVRRHGYHEWVKSGVLVRAGECHVEGVVLTARLVPET